MAIETDVEEFIERFCKPHVFNRSGGRPYPIWITLLKLLYRQYVSVSEHFIFRRQTFQGYPLLALAAARMTGKSVLCNIIAAYDQLKFTNVSEDPEIQATYIICPTYRLCRYQSYAASLDYWKDFCGLQRDKVRYAYCNNGSFPIDLESGQVIPESNASIIISEPQLLPPEDQHTLYTQASRCANNIRVIGTPRSDQDLLYSLIDQRDASSTLTANLNWRQITNQDLPAEHYDMSEFDGLFVPSSVPGNDVESDDFAEIETEFVPTVRPLNVTDDL